ncbi:MAG: hypothetical protein ACRDV9_12060, partial [Acidimicrobiia bacterium]
MTHRLFKLAIAGTAGLMVIAGGPAWGHVSVGVPANSNVKLVFRVPVEVPEGEEANPDYDLSVFYNEKVVSSF